MAVMNGTNLPPSMHGGIDQQITDRIGRANGNPQALMQKYGSSKNILDLIAMQRAVSLVAEQRKNEDLQKVGNPYTIADQLGEQVVADQKELMMGPLQKLRGKTEDVGGVLGNQQMQGAPTMAAAQGGIINAPAPNLTRMYNGGIVGYAEGGEVDEDAFRARVIALVKSGVSAEKATAQAKAEFANGSRNKFGIRYPSEINKDPQGARFLDREKAPKEEPTAEEEQLARLNALSEESPKAIGLPKRELGTTAMGMGAPPIQEDIVAPVDPTATVDSAVDPVVKPEGIETALPKGGFSPVMTKKERGIQDLKNLGLDKKQEFDFEPFMRKSKFNPNQSPLIPPKTEEQKRQDELKAEATKDIKDTPEGLTGSAAIKAQLDKMGGKKGIAGLVERFANTNFRPSYGGTGEALAEAGRNISEAGQKENARERKFLEDQLGVQQGIEAKGIEAAESTRQYEATLGQRVAEQEESAKQWGETFDASNAEFIKTFDQSAKHKETLEGLKNTELEIQRLTAANTGRSLDAQTQEAKTQTLILANDLIRKLQTDTDKLIQEEVSAIENSSTIDVEDKSARAKEWRAKREAERDERVRLIYSSIGGGSGAGGLTVTARK